MAKDFIMVRMQLNRDKVDKWEGKLCPKPRARLLKNVKEASGCMPTKSDKAHFQVYFGSTSNQCVVDLEKRIYSCRKWQLTGIPCKKSWSIKKAGRPRRLRRVNPIKAEGNNKNGQCKVRKYLCSICKESGHNSRTCKKKNESNEPAMGEEVGDHGPTTHDNVATSQNDQGPSQASVSSDTPPLVRPMPPRATFFSINPRGVAIRAPPPMLGASAEQSNFQTSRKCYARAIHSLLE
ncbi:hypothetical protein LIER_25811 [Lithospermum erythrorhizon]|uniref:Uncharacterized protein n=1 Tax=Lithospermum erythrorhizon TaxID=34254 RepID=A0AAV3R9U9_LITER